MNDVKDEACPGPRKIGEYLDCGQEIIGRALLNQQRLAAEGVKKPLGAVLLESQVITHEVLT
ncbi:MAG: hypothetical protein ACREIQ_01680, partial [Nitrospiria bacterium]